MAPKKAAAKKAAAKKAATPKPPAPKQPQPKSFMARGVGVNKKSQAGDLGSERAVLRQAAQQNRKARQRDEAAGGLGWGPITVTYTKNGKLENSVVNRKGGNDFPSSNYLFLKSSKKKKK
jgi:hypothetical protein